MASGKGHGSMSPSMKFIRLLIILLNLVFVIAGGILLGIGIFVVKDPKMQQLRPLLNPDATAKYSQTLSNIEIFAIILIVIGGILLFIGFLGCCGAIKGFKCLHILYAIIIGGIILAEIIIIILFMAYQNSFKSDLVGKLQKSIQRYYVGPPINNSTVSNPISLSWDFAQFNFQCCGAINKSDYLNTTSWNRTNPYYPNTTLTVPFTCCALNATKNWNGLPTNMIEANTCATTGTTAYTQGCYDRLVDLVYSYKKYVIIGGAIIGVVEILAFLFAILLYCRKADYNAL
ncbi:unnamed protein product [Adineta steineri]|uniref:Tetraspanin n=1 Tax=Adineta steineri TaxID=433720 RepID=A0A813WTC7_9BILA|nr:unnamed protein product [Adineta steineri]CAF0861859.1 unnamed protein product [Adineta steineri]